MQFLKTSNYCRILFLAMSLSVTSAFAEEAPVATKEASSKTAVEKKDVKHKAEGKKAALKENAPKDTTVVIQTTEGNITVKLFPEKAPKTVENFLGLATGKKEWTDTKTGKQVKGKPLYSGTVFHRVIPDFMVQAGDPLGNGTGGPGYQFEDEFKDTDSFDHEGILAMANAGPNTNGSQFFITVKPTPWLNGKHTIFGEVIKGMDIVQKISNVERTPGDVPKKEIKIKKIQVKS